MADNNKKRLDTSNFPIYRSKKTNKNTGESTYQAGTGLHVSESARKVLGNEGVQKISQDVGVGSNKISTGGGDPLPKGSRNNKFLVAENKEEAEEMRERTDGEIPVRTLQYRDENGQFSNSPDDVEGKIKENIDNDKDYLKKASGLDNEEFEKRIKSIGMTKEEFISEASKSISTTSREVVDKHKLMKHLREERGLSQKQAARIYGDRKYGLKDSKDLKNEDARIRYFEIMNESVRKAKDPAKRMKNIWNSKKASERMKQMHENAKLERENKNATTNDVDRAIGNVKRATQDVDLSKYSQSDINKAKEFLESKGQTVNKGTIKSIIDKRLWED